MSRRQDWDAKSSLLGDEFNIDEHMGVFSATILKSAQDAYDIMFPVTNKVH